MASIFEWSKTAGDNDEADSAIDWREGQLPDTVNNSARAMMGRVAEWRDDVSGALVAGGTGNALTVTCNSSFTTYQNGLAIIVRATADNTGAATINVNSLGSKAIRRMGTGGDAALASGMIKTGHTCVLVYSTAANSAAGAWILVNPVLDAVFAAASHTHSGADITSGTVADARLSSNVALKDTNNNFSTNQSITGTLTVSGAITGASFTGSGSGLTGVVPTARTLTAGDGLSGGGDLSANRSFAVDSTVVRTTRTLTAGTGLTGGGTLAADRTFAVSYGTTSGTATQGNDTRVVNAVQTSRTLTAGNGLTGGGTLAADRTFAVGAGDGISVAADEVAVDSTVARKNVNNAFSTNQSITGTLSVSSTITVDGSATFSNGVIARGSNASLFFRPHAAGTSTNQMELATNGNLTVTGTVTASSDETLKADWQGVAGDFVDRLAGVLSGTYFRRDLGVRHAGVGAQSLREILPEAVVTSEDGVLSVAYGNAALVACVELAREVKRLRRLVERD